jgi:hypothetical protein
MGWAFDVGTETVLAPGTGESQWTPAAAFNGTDTYLAVWSQGSGIDDGDADIYGVRIKTDGSVLDATPIRISGAADFQKNPRAAWNGTEWLVVWQDMRNGTDYDVYAARVTLTGAVRDTAGIAVCTQAKDQILPNVASDGNAFLVVWSDYRNGKDYNLYDAVITEGVAASETLLASTPAEEIRGNPVWNGSAYLVGCAKSWRTHAQNSWGQFTVLAGIDGKPLDTLKHCGINIQSFDCALAIAGQRALLAFRAETGKLYYANIFDATFMDLQGNLVAHNNPGRGLFTNGAQTSNPPPVSLCGTDQGDEDVYSGSVGGSGDWFLAVHQQVTSGASSSEYALQRPILTYHLLSAADGHVEAEGGLTPAGKREKGVSVCGGPTGTFLVLYERNNAADSIQPVCAKIVSATGTRVEGVDLKEGLSLSVSPNPFYNNTVIHFNGMRRNSSLKVYDVRGKLAADLTMEMNRIGKTGSISWNVSNMASGVYVVTVKSGEVEMKRKLLLMR